ncbi:protein gar2-like isoform X2 [Camellia sinensis]|uniref:protein gar2-like isoform X2 n=1 Tax=Camellia sinensis TaxID=4442 RepID=UPI001036228F|nr:protein gar2-like isoform X2 [Camellia sinensis]
MPPRLPTRRKSTWKSKQSELELSLADQSNTVPESENKGQEALSAAVKDEGGEQVAPLVIAGVEIKQELRVLDSNYADEAVMSTAVETKVKEEERNVNVNTVSFMEDGERMEGDHDKFDNAAEEEEVEGKQNEGIHVVAEQNSSEEGTAAAQIDDAEAFVDNDNFPVLNDGSDGQEGGEVGAKDEEDIWDNEEDNEDEEQPAEFVNNHITDRKKKKDFEIFIGRLDKGAVEDDLIEVFGKFGELKAARIVRNPTTNKSRGFAFIQYMTVEQAKNALSALNEGIQVRGKHIIISASQDNDTLYMGNICKLWTKERVLGTLKSYGIENIEEKYLPADPQKEGKIKGFALLEFSTHSDAMAAFQRLRKPDAVFGRDRSAKVAFAQTPMHPNQEIRSQMADDVPHDGASPEIPPQFFPEMEAEPGPVQLPPKVRRFDPTTYDPQTYVLPPESVRHFKGFERDAQDDLLLRESASHLSYGATERLWSHIREGVVYGAPRWCPPHC